MNSPKISVIIPTYNRANLIKNTITGVINQTYADWELLVVDDGSTDNTREIVNELALKDSRIKYFYQENSGCPSAPRNLGIEKAKGKYVAFLDSDDLWFPTKLEKQLSLFENSNNPKLGIVACYLYVKDYKTDKRVSKHDKYYRGDVLEEIIKGNFNPFTASCIMTKLSILKEAGPFDIIFKTSEDTDMWVRIAKLGYEFDFVPEYLLDYVIHDSNTFYKNNKISREDEFIKYVKKHYELHVKYNSPDLSNYYFLIKLYKPARKLLFRDLLKHRYSIRQKIRIIGQIIITFYPPSEQIWKKLKRLFTR